MLLVHAWSRAAGTELLHSDLAMLRPNGPPVLQRILEPVRELLGVQVLVLVAPIMPTRRSRSSST
jgi:hypothetical protein